MTGLGTKIINEVIPMTVKTIDLIENPGSYVNQLRYNADTGSTSVSLRGLSRICGVDPSSMHYLLREFGKLCTGVGEVTHKIARTLYQSGFQGVGQDGYIDKEKNEVQQAEKEEKED